MKTNNNQEDFRKPIPLGCAYSNPNKANNKSSGIIRLIHRGTGGEQGWIYSIHGVMSTIPSSCYKDPPKILIRE